MLNPTPLDAFQNLLREDRRYRPEAYRFLIAALDYAQNAMALGTDVGDGQRHVTGQDLCRAAQQYATKEYGMLAKAILAAMGIRSSSDMGEIVYNLIRIGQMNQTEGDHRDDFNNVIDFSNCFEDYQIVKTV